MHEPNLCFVCNPSLYIEAKSFQLGQTDGKEAPPSSSYEMSQLWLFHKWAYLYWQPV